MLLSYVFMENVYDVYVCLYMSYIFFKPQSLPVLF